MDADPDPAAPPEAYPWEHGDAAPADRALGLELELIELEHEREEAELEGGPVEPIVEEITEVLDSLEDTVEQIAGPDDESHVEIDAPEAAELVDPDGPPADLAPRRAP